MRGTSGGRGTSGAVAILLNGARRGGTAGLLYSESAVSAHLHLTSYNSNTKVGSTPTSSVVSIGRTDKLISILEENRKKNNDSLYISIQ